MFAKFAVVRAKSRVEVRVYVEFADDFAVGEDGDDDFGFGFERAGEIARVCVDVVDNDGFSGGCGGPADALVKRNAGVGRHGAFEGTEDEDVRARFLFEHVEANPVVARELFVEERHNAFHESVRVGGAFGEGVQRRNEFGRLGECGHGV